MIPMRVLVAIPLITLAALAAGEPTETKPNWHADWPTAQRIAKAANKPIFVVFVCRH